MMKPASRRLILLAAALAAGCVSGGRSPASARTAEGPRPDWLEGDGSEFPRARYVTGVGSADEDSAASDRARGEVARVFSADVSVNTSLDESESTLGRDGARSESFSQSVAQSVRTATRKALEGVDVVRRWRDPSGRWYALAVLPKAQALLAVTEKLQDLDEQAAAWKAALNRASGRFDKAVAAAKLLALAKAREPLATERRVLGGGGEPGDDLGAVKAEAAQALAALNVRVSATGEGADAVATGLVSGLNAAGLSAKLTADEDSADVTASAAVSVQPGEGGDLRWKWARAVATIDLRDARSGKTFSRFELYDREASADAGEARRRALAALAKKASARVKSALDDFFANQ